MARSFSKIVLIRRTMVCLARWLARSTSSRRTCRTNSTAVGSQSPFSLFLPPPRLPFLLLEIQNLMLAMPSCEPARAALVRTRWLGARRAEIMGSERLWSSLAPEVVLWSSWAQRRLRAYGAVRHGQLPQPEDKEASVTAVRRAALLCTGRASDRAKVLLSANSTCRGLASRQHFCTGQWAPNSKF